MKNMLHGPKKVALGLGAATLVLLVAAVVPLILYRANKEPEAMPACKSNLKVLGMANAMYVADNDDRFPLAARWMDGLGSYVKEDRMFRCPAVRQGYGYAMNRSMSGARETDVQHPSEVPLLYDYVTLTRNAHEIEPKLPNPGRHDGLSYVLFVDSSIRAVSNHELPVR